LTNIRREPIVLTTDDQGKRLTKAHGGRSLNGRGQIEGGGK